MRPSLQAFMKAIKGKTVFIVGGGTSALNVDFSLLQDEVVICINDSLADFPNATAIYWVDETWASENYDFLKAHKVPHRFTSKPAQHINYDRNGDPKTIAQAAVLKRTSDNGYDPAPDHICGNNSGVQVLNLVVNMKPKRIVLIGFDMQRDTITRKTHYHNKSRLPIQDHIYNDLFVPSMDGLAKGIEREGSLVEIINANPNSALRCFKFGVYMDYLKD
jgi:hypothetical protein